MHWVSEGKRDREIAIILNLSPRTVEKHLSHILDKFGVETRTGAVNEFRASRQYPLTPFSAPNKQTPRSKQLPQDTVGMRRSSLPQQRQ